MIRKLRSEKTYEEISEELNITAEKARNYFYFGMVEARNSNNIKKLIESSLKKIDVYQTHSSYYVE
jgi:hypothetical protein